MAIRSVLCFVGVLLLDGVLAAQVPDGSFVIISFQNSATGSLGGLFIVDPRIPGALIPISGLGPDLTGNNTGRGGSNCVTIQPETGILLVGEIGTNQGIELHQLVLAGSTVVLDTTITVGRPRIPAAPASNRSRSCPTATRSSASAASRTRRRSTAPSSASSISPTAA